MDLYELIKLAKAYEKLDEYSQAAIEGLGAGHPVCDFDDESVEAARKWLARVNKSAERFGLETLEAESDMLVADIDDEKKAAAAENA